MYKKVIKQILDIFISLILLPIVLLFIFFFGIFIYLEDHGPIFYISNRIGKNGKIFQIVKLRTMVVNAQDLRNSDFSTFNSTTDLRVTKIGKILRKLSIDELPQIFNVLTGDMSLIGPRPDLPDALKYFPPNYKFKLKVKPGITGYNQVKLRNQANINEIIDNDIYYVNNLSFSLDFYILVKTFFVILDKKKVFRN